MVHQNSLMYNVYAIPFYPMKVYWFVKKVSRDMSGDQKFQNFELFEAKYDIKII